MADNPRSVDPGRAVWTLVLILIGGFCLRLICLRSPLLETYALRQNYTAMVARNFHRHGYRLLWPEVDLNGNGPGCADSEFPLYPFITALLYGVFGEHEALGRLLNALIAVAIAYLVFLLGGRHYGHAAGLWAAALFSVSPVPAFFGRNFQPDMMMLFFGVTGLYTLCVALEEKRNAYLVLSSVALALAGMTKPTVLHILIPAAYLWWRHRGSAFLRSPVAWAWLVGILLPVAMWFTHAYRMGQTSGVTFISVGSGAWFHGSAAWDLRGLQNIASRLLILVFTPVGALFMLPSLGRRSENAGRLYPVWLASALAYVGLVGHLSRLHHYYQLPLFPVAEILIGAAIATARSRRLAIVCGGFMALSLSFAWCFVLPWYNWDEQKGILDCGRAVHRMTGPRDLLISVDPHGGALIYCSDRKGYHYFSSMLTSADLADCIRKGARTMAIAPAGYWTHLQPAVARDLNTKWKLVSSTDGYRLYRLEQSE